MWASQGHFPEWWERPVCLILITSSRWNGFTEGIIWSTVLSVTQQQRVNANECVSAWVQHAHYTVLNGNCSPLKVMALCSEAITVSIHYGAPVKGPIHPKLQNLHRTYILIFPYSSHADSFGLVWFVRPLLPCQYNGGILFVMMNASKEWHEIMSKLLWVVHRPQCGQFSLIAVVPSESIGFLLYRLLAEVTAEKNRSTVYHEE